MSVFLVEADTHLLLPRLDRLAPPELRRVRDAEAERVLPLDDEPEPPRDRDEDFAMMLLHACRR
jgi:hypothetical protein